MPFFPFSIRYHDIFTLLYFHMYASSFNMIFLVVCSQRQTETSTLPLDVSLCLCKHTSRDELAIYSSNFHLLHFLLSCWGEGIWVEWIIQDEIIWTLTIWRWMILEWVAVRSLVVNHRYRVHPDKYTNCIFTLLHSADLCGISFISWLTSCGVEVATVVTPDVHQTNRMMETNNQCTLLVLIDFCPV